MYFNNIINISRFLSYGLYEPKQYKELEIEIGDNFFSPKEATVEEGTIVIWTNKGNMLHDVRWDNAPASDHIGGDIKADLKNKDFSSKTMGTGDINVALFDKVGKYTNADDVVATKVSGAQLQ